MAKNVSIIRADGSIDTFKPQKVKQSLHNAGATPQEIDQILIEITNRLEEGMSTREIYQEAFRLLKKSDRPAAARYSIKQAIMDLGPSGYPFEQLLGRLMERLGYTVTFPEQVSGKCITHEVDVVAEKAGQKIMIEAKFHNQPGFRTDTKTALYVKARFDDIKAIPANKFQQGWLVTNTKLTGDAIRYSTCSGVKTLGWNHPKGKGIEVLLNQTKLQPITVLTSLNKKEKRTLLDNNLVICADLQQKNKLLTSLGFSQLKINTILTEVEKLLK